MMATTHQKIQELADKVATMLELGDTSAWTKPWRTTGYIPNNALTQKNYHGVNQLVLWIEAAVHGYKTHTWMTFKQKNALAERLEQEITIRKGQHSTAGYRYVTWIPSNFKMVGNDLYMDVTTGNHYREFEVTRFTLKTFNVFNIDQMDGIPDSYYASTEPAQATHIQAKAIFSMVENTKAEVRHGHPKAAFYPRNDFIIMPHISDFISNEDYFSTLFHELTHWTGHESRLDRLETAHFGDESYAKEELVAEFGSAFLCADFQIEESQPQHEAYLISWAKDIRDDPDLLFNAVRKAEKAHTYIQNLNAQQQEKQA